MGGRERPALRSDFCNLTILDGEPDHDRLRAKIVKALDVIPRLRQRVVAPPLRLAPPEWIDDVELDLSGLESGLLLDCLDESFDALLSPAR